MIRLLAVLVLAGVSVNGQTITQTFGTGANQFSIDFVTIGNPGNAADDTGFGRVNYAYNLGKYEISRPIIQRADSEASLGIPIISIFYNKPAATTWYGAAKFVNWLNTSKGYQSAYKFDANGNFLLWNPSDPGYQAANAFRNSLAQYWIPSTDEWYKGAYGNLDGTWNNYSATQSDNAPFGVAGGTNPWTAVFNQPLYQGPADVDKAGGLSAWGTMGQEGNVWEFLETASDGINDNPEENREMRGGNWANQLQYGLGSTVRSYNVPNEAYEGMGFRIAMVPEPSSLSLLLAGGLVALARRRKS